MPDLPPFPVDDSTLDLISLALDPGPDAERTSLSDLLDLLSRMAGSDPEAVGEVLSDGDPYESGRATPEIHLMRDPIYHDHDVIRALVAEVRRLRNVDAVTMAVDFLNTMPTDDPERAHGLADDTLLAVAPSAVAAAYRAVGARCRWWAAA